MQPPREPALQKNGRGDWIRTNDFYVPNVALYQAELHPDTRRNWADPPGRITCPADCLSKSANANPNLQRKHIKTYSSIFRAKAPETTAIEVFCGLSSTAETGFSASGTLILSILNSVNKGLFVVAYFSGG